MNITVIGGKNIGTMAAETANKGHNVTIYGEIVLMFMILMIIY